ncbi:MAG: hypothetical protein KJZ86_00885 [Caldilineaceae bacterium]|nr:hypothetical protein [Caldilineaceae bacterium]
MAELFAFGRHTITQLLLTLGLVDEDWSAWYRIFSEGRFDEEKTGAVMLGEALTEVPADDPFMVSTDSFHMPRSSQTMPGTGWMRGLRTAKFKGNCSPPRPHRGGGVDPLPSLEWGGVGWGG